MEYSKFQQDIFNFVKENPNASFCVSAVAGSGKTFTLVEIIKRIASSRCKVLGLAFNKTIATEWQSKMERIPNAFPKTLHSHGFSSFFAAKVRTKVDSNKWRKYIQQNPSSSVIGKEDKEFFPFCTNVYNLLEKCRINLVKVGETETIEALADKHSIVCIADEVEVVNNLLNIVYDIDLNQRCVVIDYTDMIVAPLKNRALRRCLPQYDVVCIDEAQDLNRAQQELLKLSIKEGGHFIAVGDPHQAINGFCGAMNDSFDRLVELANGNQLPLSVNYRCGRKMIELAHEIVEEIEAHSDAIEGIVEDVTDLKGARGGDMIICRKSAPLIGLCLRFLANGKVAYVKGADICEGLKNTIKKSKASNLIELQMWLEQELNKIRTTLLSKGIAENAVENCPSVINFQDKIKALEILSEGALDLDDIYRTLDRIFTEVKSGNAIALSTIHKSKGLEADRVFILLPMCLPMTWKDQQQWEYEQECNLKYVALTRAKKELYFVQLDADQLREVEVV